MPSIIQQGKCIHSMLLGYQPYLQTVRSFQGRESWKASRADARRGNNKWHWRCIWIHL